MRVGISIWRGRISTVFDVSRKVLVLHIENGAIKEQFFEFFESDYPNHKLSKLIGVKVDTLICGAISNQFLEMITQQGIHVFPFTCGTVDDVIQAVLNHTLTQDKFAMPGCCNFRKRMRNQFSKIVEDDRPWRLAKGNRSCSNGNKAGTGSGGGRCLIKQRI